MTQPDSLLAFKKMTHVFYFAYCMANAGMQYIVDYVESMDGYNPEGVFQIGRNTSDHRRLAVAALKNKDALSGMRKDGPFSQIIAHGTINWIYSLWNEEYRAKVAAELELEVGDVMCDVMGDLRIIRNFIVHDNAVADRRVDRLKVLRWIKEGPLVFVGDDMDQLQCAINAMEVYKRTSASCDA